MAGQPLTRIREKLPTDWTDLDKVLEELDITPTRILCGVLNIAENGDTTRDRLKAWDLLSKFAGIKPPERVLVSSDLFDIVLTKADSVG